MKRFLLMMISLSVIYLFISTDKTTTKVAHTHSTTHPLLIKKSIKSTREDFFQSSAASLLPPLLEASYPAPTEWGLDVTGVKNSLSTEQKVVALTFDACGSTTGNGYDEELMTYLIQENIPATLFLNQRWIQANQEIFTSLAEHPLFEIENHGTHHRPLSTAGQSAYGIPGTNSPEEVLEEVMSNHRYIAELTGREPKFFRSGTAHYDEVAVGLLGALGLQVVNFDLNGDAGATFSSQQVENSLLQAQPGSIAILHMNQPESETAEGIQLAVPKLRDQNYTFVKLEDYPLQ
ncbi:polysaccharide deacetylase family protein [Bacillus sp. 2205SS5-2]|uniref:polysaccharide deacetylase family protein n=1 Tax=Bacillus sp. 2205SS5-2 TaxID=3109031 RepID=UPI0030064408